MSSIRSRLLCAVLAALLALSAPFSALAAAETPDGAPEEDSADLLEISVPDYTPTSRAGAVENIQGGQRYTLIVLPSSAAMDGSSIRPLSAELLLESEPLFVGSAVAAGDSDLTFRNIHLRTAEAAVYYVTGPGLESAPLAEAANSHVAIHGQLLRKLGENVIPLSNATISLVDEATGYAYANSTSAGANGAFSLLDLSPGKYRLHADKPGYLPADDATFIDLSSNTFGQKFDISRFIGDVNGDGRRGLADLTAFLSCYGASSVPQGLTPDLDESGRADPMDVVLLLNAMQSYDGFPGGKGVTTGAETIVAADALLSGQDQNRALTFSLQNAADGLTFTAAHVALSFRTDFIQPVNADGGAVYPGNNAAAANCLVPKSGVTVTNAAWTVDGDLATLVFSLVCETPSPLTGLVDFRYRPASGKTVENFFDGVFALDHAAAQVGQIGLIGPAAFSLEYPHFSSLDLTAITIDQADSTLTIPSGGRTAVLMLSATGTAGEAQIPDLPGVTWSLETPAAGVSIQNGLLTVTQDAKPGTVQIRASFGEISSLPLTITLENASPVPTDISIQKNGEALAADLLSGTAGTALEALYQVKLLDQYGADMPTQDVVWGLSGAPSGVSVDETGTVRVADTLAAGTYEFSLLASMGSLRASVNLALTLESDLRQLVLSGPSTLQIPSADPAVTLRYTLTALDAQGNMMATGVLNPSFTVTLPDGDPAPGVAASYDMTGNLSVTVDRTAQAGDVTLRAAVGEVEATLTLTLELPHTLEDGAPLYAAVSYQDEVADAPAFTLYYGDSGRTPFVLSPLLFDKDGRQAVTAREEWTWQVDGAPDGVSHATQGKDLQLTVADNTPCNVYFFTVTARDAVSRLQVTVPVTLRVLPRLVDLTLTLPASLNIPATGLNRCPIGVTANGSDGSTLTLPGGLTWQVVDADQKTPVGVSVQNGELSITPSAKPGSFTLNVLYDENGDGKPERTVATASFTLAYSGSEPVLALRRGEELLSGGVDAIYGKEGQVLTLDYTPVLLNPVTGEAAPITEGIVWVGAQGSFTVEAAAEPGIYTAPVTAIYRGQSVSLTAKITVYPDITALYIDFDQGDLDSANDRYRFMIPSLGAVTYRGTVMAVVNRGGKTANVPLIDLGLTDYDLDIYTNLTGLYTAYDRATGRLSLTIEPTADFNSMAEPPAPSQDYRCFRVVFSYYPDQEPYNVKLPLLLDKETARITNAVLRQGDGTGTRFSFETAPSRLDLTLTPGVVSYCYALELIDQYGNAVTLEDSKIDWTLTGAPTDASGRSLVTLIRLDTDTEDKYKRYSNIVRLRVDPTIPLTENGAPYRFTVAASAAGFTRSIDISLTVAGEKGMESLTVSGPESQTIPQYYAQPNSSSLNAQVKNLTYVAVAQNAVGDELDASLCDFVWKVTTANGRTPRGVSVRPTSANPAVAIVSIDRTAQPTMTGSGSSRADVPLRVTVTVTPKDGGAEQARESYQELSLTRASLVPYLMNITGPTRYQMNVTDGSISQLYTFSLVNQYNGQVSQRDAEAVEWSLSGGAGNVRLTTTQDNRGYPAARITIQNPRRDTEFSFELTASVTYADASSSTGKTEVLRTVSVQVVVGAGSSPDPGNNPGQDAPPPPAEVTTVTPSTSKSGTTGTATLTKDDSDALIATTTATTLTIAPKNTEGLTSITVNFPASMASAISRKTVSQSLRIQTAIGTVTLPSLADFAGSGTCSVTILNQNNTLAVTFRDGKGQEISRLSRNATFSAPVQGDMVTSIQGGLSADVLTKTVISNKMLSVSLSGSAQLTVGPRGKVFSDTQNHWAKAAVDFVTARGLFQGTSETTFDPSGDMTRGMVVTVLHRLENLPPTSAANIFRDVPNGTWYTTAVVWANDKGIVKGTGDGFLPNDPVTREQLATILYRYMDTLGKSTSQRATLSSFSDGGKVSSWAKDAMEWAVATGLINGKNGGILDPGGKASRAEVATMLERLVRSISPSA